MKMPRNVSGQPLIKALGRLGYETTRQTGSLVRLEYHLPRRHHLTVPLHDPLRIGTRASILSEVAKHRSLSREDAILKLFGGD